MSRLQTNSDSFCDVGVSLFVCDGSVFPTTGDVNPHLTIHALALRTASRIAAQAKREGASKLRHYPAP